MATVSNSSPIIHLTKIGMLELLHELFGQIFIPEMVYSECTNSIHHQDEVCLIKKADWINVVPISNRKLFNILYQDVDAGEGEALVLAMERNADLILLDDQEARSKARILDLHVTGTLGVLLKAKSAGLIDSGTDYIQLLQDTGFWISPKLLAKLLKTFDD